MRKIVLFIASSWLLNACAQQNSGQLLPESIHKNTIKVGSIDPDITNFNDLQELKTIFKNKQLVLLGEQTHGEGSTFSAKVRLIKFLHKEMGFNVLAFESGMYDCAKIWQNMQAGNEITKEIPGSLFYMYANSTEIKPLFHYFDEQKTGNNPLILTGMDSQHTGKKTQELLVKDLLKFLEEFNNQTIDSKEANWNLFRDKTMDLFKMNTEVKPEEKKAFYETLETLKKGIQSIKTKANSLSDSPGFWLQILESIESQAQRYWGDIADIDRDRQMADNLLWLLNNPFKGKKMMVWAHNVHIAGKLGDFLPMGFFLKEALGDKMYTLAFTAYDGFYIDFASGNKMMVPEPDAKSIETTLENMHLPYAILDFNKKNVFRQPLSMRIVDFNEFETVLPNLFDGVFFIKNTIPTIQN